LFLYNIKCQIKNNKSESDIYLSINLQQNKFQIVITTYSTPKKMNHAGFKRKLDMKCILLDNKYAMFFFFERHTHFSVLLNRNNKIAQYFKYNICIFVKCIFIISHFYTI